MILSMLGIIAWMALMGLIVYELGSLAAHSFIGTGVNASLQKWQVPYRSLVMTTAIVAALTAIAWSAMSAWLFSVSSPFGVGKRSIWLGLGAGLTVFVCVFPFIYASQRSLLTMSMIIPVIFIVFFVLAGYWLSTIFSTSAAYKYTPVFGKQFRGRKGGKN